MPVFIKCSANIGASICAAHGNDYIRIWNIRNQLGILRLFHVNTIEFLHDPHCIRIQASLQTGTRGITDKDITGKGFAKCFGDLGAAGIMNTDKRNFFNGFIRQLSPSMFRIKR